jgi:magnesium transporter
MITSFVHANGRTSRAESVDPAWLRPDSGVILWVNLADPSPDEARILSDVFKFHELAIEDALSELHHPKIESYEQYIYLVLHGIDFHESQHRFATQEVDFFLGPNYLVSVHSDPSRSIERLQQLCMRNEHVIAEGASSLLHRIVDQMVDNYRPEVEKLSDNLEKLEEEVFESPDGQLIRRVLALKRDVASLRRVVLPQRDVVGRLARREFQVVSDQVTYRFRDVYDHLVRMADEAMFYQDRITSILDVHLSNVSNRLNQVVKVLTVIATIFMPLTVLTGAFGMNVTLPAMPGGPAAQFWWIMAIMVLCVAVMLWFFRLRRWL